MRDLTDLLAHAVAHLSLLVGGLNFAADTSKELATIQHERADEGTARAT